ncbi:MAG: hypothetical protein V3U52_05260 [Thermoplasmata archaeon]
MNEENDITVKLPHGLSLRIAKVLEDNALGYSNVNDFVLAGVRHELREAELAAYWSKQEGRR